MRSSRVRLLIGEGGDKLLLELTGLRPGDQAYAQIADERTDLLLRRYLRGLSAIMGRGLC